MSSADQELDAARSELAAGHDVIRFMTEWHAVADLRFQPLPSGMLEMLRNSGDWWGVVQGVPNWIQVEADNGAAELVLYQPHGTDRIYVLAPVRDAEA